MEENFKVGDVVQLKSGGPKMTVKYNVKRTKYGTLEQIFEGRVACQWFEGPKLEGAEFEQDMLKAIEG